MKQTIKEYLEDIENNFENIYIKPGFKPKNIQEVILELFQDGLNVERNVIKSVATYRDPECAILQCLSGKNRSLGAVFNCVKTYLPETTLKDVVYSVLSTSCVSPTGSVRYLNMNYCPDIRKPVLFFFYLKSTWRNPENVTKYGHEKFFKYFGITKEMYNKAT